MKRVFIILFSVLAIDQVFKIWIKTHFYLGEELHIFDDWFILHFTENNGMAFGLELEGSSGKLTLSLFRILAVAGIGWYVWHLIKQGAHKGLIGSLALILAGALGNIIDSLFYGLIFSESDPFQQNLATLFPNGGGYASFLHGKVVDMLYFPLFDGYFPDWFPIWSGEYFQFFRPVFNIADSSITIGVALIILFQKRFFKAEKEKQDSAGGAPGKDTD